MELIRKVSPAEFYSKFLSQKIRPDGRGLESVRQTFVSVGVVSTALGSAFVRVGQTSVIAGIRAEVGKPDVLSSQSQPLINLNLELTPLCSSLYKSGQQTPHEAVVVVQTLRRLLTRWGAESLMSEMLQIEKDVLSWYLYIDLYCLNHDGNLLDPCVIALVAALHDLKLPRAVMKDDKSGAMIVEEEAPRRLVIKESFVSLSFGMIEDTVVVDPTHEEEGLMKGVTSIAYGTQGGLYCVLKSGGTPLTSDALLTCFELAKKRTSQVAKLIQDAVSNAASISKNSYSMI